MIATLSLADAPAYLFEDVMEIPGPTAWFFRGIVWTVATLLINGSPGLDLTASVALYRFTGIAVDAQLTIAGGLLAGLYSLAAYGEYAEGNEGV